ncbi:MopE-related protein [Polyangium sp. y55x31]|uniref:formylglycine-generating enzyme family protein n=1 Tax=Polyangium sp. y55x31 TaxID=3042688 RepID=UPI0024824058|nr:MopE-related protein [Polyangium sp. y55x31]MDI1476216.1 MopE-related protein [Polyangium sp. y55x31]
MKTGRTMRLGVFAALLPGMFAVLLGSGCVDDAFCFSCGADPSGSGASGGMGGVGGEGGEGGIGFGGFSQVGGGPPCDADLLNDVDNCGACDNKCLLPSAFPRCEQGVCVVDTCVAGSYDVDGDPKNGCEYACPVPVLGPEQCNGIDDDCDGKVDSADPDLVAPSNLCTVTAGTPCEGTMVVCNGASGWSCVYPPEVEVVAGFVRVTETRCDGVDGNCDGSVDEWFQDLGSACDDGGLGKCVDVGVVVCDPQNPATTTCDLSILPDAAPPTAELCNGVDDDCDGFVDEELDPSAFDMDAIPGSNPPAFVDRYEASRPDASMQAAGILESVACSKPQVLPWTGGSFAEAEAACAARGPGFRLCSAAELEAACRGPASMLYPYGATYDAMACLGVDNPAAMGAAVATGSLAACVSGAGPRDLSGNVTEWTRTQTNAAAAPNRIFQLHGGSYLSPALGLACTMELPARAAEGTLLPNIGFRCCRQ